MRRRYDQLDGLRGVAALMVVLAHYVLAFQPAMYFGTIGGTRVSFAAAPGIAGSPLTLLFQPELAVAVFFVLSGFVLAAGVEARPAPLAELALRRWLRLSIPVLATSIAVWAMLRTGLHADRRLVAINHSSWLDMNFVWLAWESNDLRTVIFQALIDVYVRGRHWWNTALWTMPIEFWGSLGLFAAYAALRRLRAASGWRLATAAGAFVMLWHTPYASFAAGAGIYELCRCDTRGARRGSRVRCYGRSASCWAACRISDSAAGRTHGRRQHCRRSRPTRCWPRIGWRRSRWWPGRWCGRRRSAHWPARRAGSSVASRS